MWFAEPGEDTANVYSHTRPNWFAAIARETRAARSTAIVIDQSSFGKHLIQGRDACRVLNRLCAGDVDVAPGRIVYTHMLNRAGGIETDLTVTRIDTDSFLLISSATTHSRDKAWITRHLPADAHVTLTDVTSGHAVLSLQGPNARAILAAVADADLGNDAFPFATSREIDLGYARVRANRLTYIGELGWELLIPTEFAQHVCDRLLAAGAAHGLQPAGYHALEHMRSERAYREYGFDLTPEDTPLEAGLGFAVRLDKPGGFVGREALLRQKQAGPLTKRLVCFRLRDPEPVLFHDEPIRLDGRIVGYISSGAYGFTLGRSVGMGYVRHPEGVTPALLEAGQWDVEVGGVRHACDASLRAFFDPAGERLGR
jgi:4-methylaminobutanoate oxidase (formaldehyde-forming)